MRWFTTKRCIAVFALPAVAAIGYAALCLWFVAHQREFQYTLGEPTATPGSIGFDDFSVVEITTEDGERLVGWWAPPATLGGGTILYFHGTPGTIADYAAWRFRDLRKIGLGVLAIDYRGVGRSTGRPTEAGIRADARAAYDFIHAAAPQSKIAVFGESFGTGVAVALATQRPVAGVLLNAPFASELRLFKRRGLPLPYRLLLADQYDSETLIGHVNAPVMILHGTADERVPIAEARRLYAAAHQPKTMIEIPGAGHMAAWDGGAEPLALKALAAWTASDPQPSRTRVMGAAIGDITGE